MSDLLLNFCKNWQDKFAKEDSKPYLLAVSGGVDSMVMFSMFLKCNIPFAVAHCNFQLRGADADLDERLVKDLCLSNNITCHTAKFETAAVASEWKKGIQETARVLRYEWFELLRKEYHFEAIATAHHADDNVETLLINLFRGTGIAGLHGILPQSSTIIRPLLFAHKSDLIAYSAEHNVSFREDASNETDDYLRNAIRHNIIPEITKWVPNAVSNITDSIERFGEAGKLYYKAVEQERKKLIEQRGNDYYIPVLKIMHREPLQTIMYELLLPFGFKPAQISHALQLLQSESGHYIASPTHRLIRNRNFLIVTTLPAENSDFILIDAAPCDIDTTQYRYSFTIQDKPATFLSSKDIAYFDMKDIVFPLYLRKWKTGDYFYPFGMGMKKKKVSRVLINEKVALHDKEEILVLESAKRILWLVGIRPDERFRVKDSTQITLVVKQSLR